jgi:type II secretory pathway pseudopilin PulG
MARRASDSGASLIELVVAMGIMTVVMAVFTTAAVKMFRVEDDTETVATAQSQVNLAFLRLDKEIRYATGISVPDTSRVEYLRTDAGGPTCTQLWLDSGAAELNTRSWTRGTTPGTGWTRLASGVTATQPFDRLAAAAPVYVQRLHLHLVVGSDPAHTKAMDTTFSALNTSLTTASDTICAEGRS